MQAHLSPSPKLRFYGRDGKPLSGGYLITYDYTTSRTCSTWADADMTTRNPFQIQLDANGEPSQNGNPVYVFLEEGRRYKFRWFDSEMNPVGCIQPVQTASVNYGDNNVFNYYASVEGTAGEIVVAASVDPETGIQTFFVGLADNVKESISSLEDDVQRISDSLSEKKDRQEEYEAEGASDTKTIKSITQDENGEIKVEFQDIDFPEQAPNVNITSPNETISVRSRDVGNTKTFEIDVNADGVEWFTGTDVDEHLVGNNSTVYGFAKIDGNIDLAGYYGHTLPLKDSVPYLVIEEVDLTTVGTFNEYRDVKVTMFNMGISHTSEVSATVRLDNTNNYTQTVTLAGILFGGPTGYPEGYYHEAYAAVANKFVGSDIPSNRSVKFKVNRIAVYKLAGLLAGQGSGATYTAGEGVKIENDEINVDYGDGLEVDPQTNKLKVKIGNGLKFNEESLEVEIDSDVEDVVESVEKLTDDLDKKITTTYPFAQITTQGDFAVFGVTNTSRMIGQLFAVPIASEIRKNETMICVNALQSFNGKVSFGIFEYDFEGNNGSGSTYWVADTGVVNVVAGENEFPLKYVDQDVHELKSSMLYYAVVAIAGDAPASGLFLAAAPNYAATYNANPKYTLLVSNMNQYIDWTTGTLQGAWFQGYNEDNTIPRLFMMLRNGEATPPIPVTEPFNDIGNFTLEHVNRVSNVFSLTPDSNGGIFRKVIPQQDVDIVSFRYVDYHGSVNQNSSTPVILDETYTPLKQVTDGSWTLGDSDQTKIDGTHYVHEFTLSTPIHLTANTPYWFLVGGNLSNQDNDWIINYQSPSVYNDLLLAKNLYNVNPYIVGNGYGEYQSSVRGMYLRLSDGTNTWVI